MRYVFALSVRLCVRLGTCMRARVEAFFDRLAVDLQFLSARRYASAGTSYGPVSV